MNTYYQSHASNLRNGLLLGGVIPTFWYVDDNFIALGKLAIYIVWIHGYTKQQYIADHYTQRGYNSYTE